MQKPGKLTLLIGGAAMTGALAYGAAMTGWHALVDAAAEQAKARRMVSDQQANSPQLPKLYTIGGGGGE